MTRASISSCIVHPPPLYYCLARIVTSNYRFPLNFISIHNSSSPISSHSSSPHSSLPEPSIANIFPRFAKNDTQCGAPDRVSKLPLKKIDRIKRFVNRDKIVRAPYSAVLKGRVSVSLPKRLLLGPRSFKTLRASQGPTINNDYSKRYLR